MKKLPSLLSLLLVLAITLCSCNLDFLSGGFGANSGGASNGGASNGGGANSGGASNGGASNGGGANSGGTQGGGDNGGEDYSGYESITYLEYTIPAYAGVPYYELGDNEPFFTESDYTTESYEYFSELDDLGRCGVVMASVGVDLMPTEERGSIGQVKPSGWQTVKYDIVLGKYLYNRCHLIGFQLTGENANERNLITGTRYMNVDGMFPFEDMVADYVKDTENHVLYRVTPVYVGDNLVAHGVVMEAWSVEDKGDGICFSVYVYNVQPGIYINYENGDSTLAGDEWQEDEGDTGEEEGNTGTEEGEVKDYILNTNTMKFHYPTCSYADDMKPQNRDEYTGTREDLIEAGYDPCGSCKP